MQPSHNRQFWGLVRQLATSTGLDKAEAEELARDDVEAIAGQRSTQGLTDRQAREVIARLAKRVEGGAASAPGAAVSPAGRRVDVHTSKPAEPDPQAPPGPEQLDALDRLAKANGWGRAELMGWARKHKRVLKPWPQTRAEAGALIEGLKAMVERKAPGPSVAEAKSQRAQLLDLLAEDPAALTPWEVGFLGKVRSARLTLLQRQKIGEIHTKRLGAS